MKMLKCFGKCSSDTYVVNKAHKQDTRNGGPKIVPLPPEQAPANGKPRKDEVKKIAPSPPEKAVQQAEPIKLNGNVVSVEETSTTKPSEAVKLNEIKEDGKVASQENLTTTKNDENSVQVDVDSASIKPTVELSVQPSDMVENGEKEKHNEAIQDSITAEPMDISPDTNSDSKTEKSNLNTVPELQKSNQIQIISDTSEVKETHKEKEENVTKEVNVVKESTVETTQEISTETKITNNITVINESAIRNEREKNIPKEVNVGKERSTEKIHDESVVTRENIIPKPEPKEDSEVSVGKERTIEKIHHESVVTRENIISKPEPKEDSAEEDNESEVYVDMRQFDVEEKKKGGNTKKVRIEVAEKEYVIKESDTEDVDTEPVKRRSGIVPLPVKYDENTNATLPNYPKDPDDEVLIRKAIESNDFLNKIISGKRLDSVIGCMYNKEISAKETIIKQGEKGSHMYVSAKGSYQVLVKGKVVSTFNDVRVFGELAILYNAKRLATIKAVTSGRVWVLDRYVYQQIMVRDNIKEQDEIMEFLMNNNKLNVVGKNALQEVANLLRSEFFSAGKQIVRQGDKGYKFYIIRAGTVTITKDGEGVVGIYKKGDCFGELALLKEDCRQATVTADPPGVECLTLTRKEFIDHFGELGDLTEIKARPQDSIKDVVSEHEDINLTDLKIIKTLGVGGFGRVELVQHTKKKDLVFALKYLKKIDIVLQHQQEHVYNEKNIQMASKSPFIVRLYRTYKDSKYIYLLMESCLGGDLWSLLQKQRLRRFEEKEARFICACVLEAFDYLHSRGIIYRDLKPENLLIAANGYIKLTDFGFAKKISSRGRTFTFAGTPEYVAPEIVLNKGHDRAVDYWAFGAFIFEMLTGRTPFRTDDSSHMKTYNKILNGIDNIQFPNYVNSKARHIVGKLCRPVPSERLGMQKEGIKDIKAHRWFLGFDWIKFAKCEIPSPFKPKLKSVIDTQHFDPFKKDSDIPPDELSGWDAQF